MQPSIPTGKALARSEAWGPGGPVASSSSEGRQAQDLGRADVSLPRQSPGSRCLVQADGSPVCSLKALD